MQYIQEETSISTPRMHAISQSRQNFNLQKYKLDTNDQNDQIFYGSHLLLFFVFENMTNFIEEKNNI